LQASHSTVTLKECVEEELDRLQKEGVRERVNYSEWAALIVVIPKHEGCIRVCGDYKVTVNPVLDIDQYPLPKLDDIFANLSGGQKFTILDLSHAYNQMLRDESSWKFVTINTHKGLFHYTRLPLGNIFSCSLPTYNGCSIAGYQRCSMYIADIIVTGTSDLELLGHLEDVLQRLQKHGIHAK